MKTYDFTGINQAAASIHKNNVDKGFWDKDRNVGEMLMLVVSELGEALEAHRKTEVYPEIERVQLAELPINGTPAEFQNAYENTIKGSFGEEAADAIIRLLDMAIGMKIDIQKHMEMKMQYNSTRDRLHGKKY